MRQHDGAARANGRRGHRGARHRRWRRARRRCARCRASSCVAARWQAQAYEDTPLPIEDGQTISQPYIVALMLASLRLQPSDRVLEISAGSGYASALASRIVARVDAVERHPHLVRAGARAPGAARLRQRRRALRRRQHRLARGRALRRDHGRGGRAAHPRCAARTSSPAAAAW